MFDAQAYPYFNKDCLQYDTEYSNLGIDTIVLFWAFPNGSHSLKFNSDYRRMQTFRSGSWHP
jgi:hypothetical protein